MLFSYKVIIQKFIQNSMLKLIIKAQFTWSIENIEKFFFLLSSFHESGYWVHLIIFIYHQATFIEYQDVINFLYCEIKSNPIKWRKNCILPFERTRVHLIFSNIVCSCPLPRDSTFRITEKRNYSQNSDRKQGKFFFLIYLFFRKPIY